MTVRFVDAGWDKELAGALGADHASLRIISPFIKRRAAARLLEHGRPEALQVITRFNLGDFCDGVSDIAALRLLMGSGARIRGVRNLHAKLYLFGVTRAIVTSANLTEAALLRNHEFGFVSGEAGVVGRCRRYFDELWSCAGNDLTAERLADWEARVTRHLATGARPDRHSGLGDEGVDAGPAAGNLAPAPWVADVPQAFVKFLGNASNRVPLSDLTLTEIRRAGCHWAVGYPDGKRPTGVKDGALIFIGRMTKYPNDIRVFGRAIGMRYEPGRDDATAEDKELRPWKRIWPRYVRVHHAEFVAGTMANGVSLRDLMGSLESDSFMSTQRNAAKTPMQKTDPRKAYGQQAAVELSREGMAWLSARLESAFAQYGRVQLADEADLDWPVVPGSG